MLRYLSKHTSIKGVLLLASERRTLIVKMTDDLGAVMTSSLSAQFGVSKITIRKDLDQLSARGLVKRVHGGAVLSDGLALEAMYRERASKWKAEKAAIGATAAALVSGRSTIFLGPGSTIRCMIPHLRDHVGLQAFTNSMRSAHELAMIESIEATIVGGYLAWDSDVAVGHRVAHFLEGLFVDQFFMSIDSISLQDGLTNFSPKEAEIYKLVRGICKELMVLADHTKFGERSCTRVFNLSEVDKIITDNQLDPAIVAGLEERGVEVLVAP